jgi:YVTN family beta-propeller protein
MPREPPDTSAISSAPTSGYMYVANSGGNTISIIDTSTNKVIDTIALGKTPLAMALRLLQLMAICT